MEEQTMKFFRGIVASIGMLALVACDIDTKEMESDTGGTNLVLSDPLVQDGGFTIRGTANVFAAGLAAVPSVNSFGELPPTISFDAGPGKILVVTGASGATNCCSSSTPNTSPDGVDGGSGTNLDSFEDISGIVLPARTMFISAVFTNGRNSSNAPPARFDYTDVDTETTAEFSPELNQVFFVGDGLTSDGTTQSFFVPASATSVSFGVADGFGFSGTPGFYNDNTGEWQMSIRLE